jgi:hypothetical protein
VYWLTGLGLAAGCEYENFLFFFVDGGRGQLASSRSRRSPGRTDPNDDDHDGDHLDGFVFYSMFRPIGWIHETRMNIQQQHENGSGLG